jgi:superfamily I DNA/RNA helicase
VAGGDRRARPGRFRASPRRRSAPPLARVEPQSGVDYAIDHWWQGQIRERARSSLAFVSINRLAELLLRANPHIRRALRATYPFVFVDEFQDTTYAQYDFLLSAFADGRTVVTAVGDNKQRIMAWAGARVDAFQRFEADFAALRIPLALHLSIFPRPRAYSARGGACAGRKYYRKRRTGAQLVDGDIAQVWNSPTRAAEAQHLTRWLADDMSCRGRSPRDYALLVRQKADAYEAELVEPLAQGGLRLRNESHALGRATLQDLLADELCRIAVALLRLGAQQRSPDAWRLASAAVQSLRGADPDDELACHRAETELTTFLAELRPAMGGAAPTPNNTDLMAARALDFLDLAAVSRTYLEYGTGDLLAIMVEAFGLHLAASADGAAWSACLDAFEGVAPSSLVWTIRHGGATRPVT